MDTAADIASDIPRTDIYRGIHKGVRTFMCDTLYKVAALDLNDPIELWQVLTQTKQLAAFCADHLRHENDFIHPAMEARQPGSAMTTSGDHVHHVEAIGLLCGLADAVEQASSKKQEAALTTLQQQLAIFVAENFEHMHFEETHNNGVLWANYSDQEIMGIEQALVASLSPQDFQTCMRWMLVGMSPAERSDMLVGIRAHAPAPVFETVLEIARACLDARAMQKLEHALELETSARLAA